MLEREFQSIIKRKIRHKLPGCIITKIDPYIQGIPDLLILYKNKWATLECKKNAKSHHQPNQDYYVGLMNEMSFSMFIYPENEEYVIKELVRFMKDEKKNECELCEKRKCPTCTEICKNENCYLLAPGKCSGECRGRHIEKNDEK